MENLIGSEFGKWKVIGMDTKKYNTRGTRYICECECGTIKSVRATYLRTGKSTSCGCSKKIDLSGQKFGKLTVLETLYNYNGKNRATYKCKCECGNIVYISSNSIHRQQSCGCSRRIDSMFGQRFGKLIVTEMLYDYKKNGETYCKCDCDCGNTLIIRANGLKTGNTTSCGCITSPSLIGKKFGRLTVVEEIQDSTPQRLWKCKCDCGRYTNVYSYTLTSGHTKSCGCLRSESVSHGETLIAQILKENDIEFEKEKTFSNCIGTGGKVLRFDFYLPEYNTLIEYDGMQHFQPVEYFGGEEKFKKQQANDDTKNVYCIENAINLIRIPYTHSDEQIKKDILCIIQNPVTTTAV